MDHQVRLPIVATHPDNLRWNIRTVRLRVLGVTLLLGLTGLITVGATAAWFARDVSAQNMLNHMVDTRPPVIVTVSNVRETKGAEHGDFFVEAELNGRMVRIVEPAAFNWNEFFGMAFSDGRYSVGDAVTVVIDPKHADRAWDVRDRRSISIWTLIGFVLFVWGLVSGAIKLIIWRMDWTFPFRLRAIPHFLWRPRTATARVVELRPGKWWDDFTISTSRATLVVEVGGVLHVWDVHTYGPVDFPIGVEFLVWGQPRLGGWAIGLTAPQTVYPRSKLD